MTVEFTPNYGSNSPPTTDYQLKLNYTADSSPQICYKTTIKDCSDALSQGPVTNKAVYTDANGTKGSRRQPRQRRGGRPLRPAALPSSQPDGRAQSRRHRDGDDHGIGATRLQQRDRGSSFQHAGRERGAAFAHLPPGPFTATLDPVGR